MSQWKYSLLLASGRQQVSLARISIFAAILLWIKVCDCFSAYRYQLLLKVSKQIYFQKEAQTNCWMLRSPPRRKSFITFVANGRSLVFPNQRSNWMSQSSTSGGLDSNTTDKSFSVNGDYYRMIDYSSLESLQRRVTLFVQHFQAQPISPKVSMVIAGGGGHLLSTLAATPGASAILLEGTTPYSRKAFQDFIQREKMTFKFGPDFKYCSAEAVAALSSAACCRALYLSASEVDGPSSTLASPTDRNWTNILRGAIGVAATSVLQSSAVTGQNADGSSILSSRRSVEKYGSRVYCAVQTSNGLQVQLFVKLIRNNLSDTDAIARPRSRFDEDVFVSHCLLTCLQLSQVNDYESAINLLGIASNTFSQHNEKNDIVIQWMSADGDDFTAAFPSSFFKSMNVTSSELYIDMTLQRAAKRILEKKDEVVMILLPSGFNNTVEVLHSAKLPSLSLIVPGSFNPPHVGHILLALAAAKEMNEHCSSIWFELSITNADKPALSIETIVERIKYFFQFRDEMPASICWGIILTNAPLFKQKVELLAPIQIKNGDSVLHFSIGTDTLVRLIDPKYYNNSRSEMTQSLSKMSCHFIVGGRLDQSKVTGSIFISGEQIISGLPLELREKFTIIPDFRIDLSSTEIRQRIALETYARNNDFKGKSNI